MQLFWIISLAILMLLLIFSPLIFYSYYPRKKFLDKPLYCKYGNVRGCEESVDFVVTWVDSSDTNWLNKKSKYCNTNISSEDRRFGFDNISQVEISTCVKSILFNAEWCRYIWIVTDNQIPIFYQFLPDCYKNRVKIVYHDKFIPRDVLPTFNSHTIETHIHNIPNLSEKFIYMNDDMYFTKKVNKSHFFCGDKPLWRTSLLFNYKHLGIFKCFFPKHSLDFLRCSSNISHMCDKKMIWRYSHHSVPLTRRMFLCSDRIYGKLNEMSNNRFRGRNEVPPIHLAVMNAYYNGLGEIFEPQPLRGSGYYYTKFYEKWEKYHDIDSYHEICINNLDSLEKAHALHNRIISNI